MNPRAYPRLALVIGTVAAGAFVAALAFFALTGCAAELPPEPGIVITTTADAAYPGRW